MSTVGYATLEVIPSVRGLQSALAKQTGSDLTAAGKTGGKRFGDAAGAEAATGFRSRLSGSLKGFAPFAGIAVGAGLVAGIKDVVGAASEAQQAVGGVQAVFGQYADQVIADSENAAQGLGLSAAAYQELITLSGALLKNKGIEDFAGQGRALVEVGADLAAQFGGSTKEAVDALNAAMRGESDPIERYAISLNETAIKAELAKMGVEGLEGAALEQAKTQARLSLIMQQSADATGAFGREADTLAGKQQRFTAQLEDMRVELGQKALPVATAFFGFLNDKGLPALEDAGGLAVDAAKGFGALPSPLKAAAGAFVALRIAAATGLTSGLAAGAGRATSAIDSLRVRTMLAADAYREARTVTRQFGGSTVQVASGVGRLSASMNATKAAATGVGGALKGSLGSAIGLLGGPWGIAIMAGTALLAKFWGEHQEAKAHVDELTGTLDKQTGAFTKNTRAVVAKRLEDEGILEAAQELGISLADVTGAALGNEGAMRRLAAAEREVKNQSSTTVLADGTLIVNERKTAVDELIAAVSKERDALGQSRAELDRHSAAMGESKTGTAALGTELQTYATKIQAVRSELQKLIEKEQERALRNIQQRRDQIALRETMSAAREEAARGARTLDINTKAGQDNMSALLDLADQWSNSSSQVQNARGAYEQMRRKFIEVAEKMGATKKEARNLADELLTIPKKSFVEFGSKGYRERMAEIAELKAAMKHLGSADLDYTPRGFGSPDSFASGGLIGGVGTGTSDSNLIWASRGEFMQRKAAVDYYGRDFMRRLNALQIPKHAGGGEIRAANPVRGGGNGVTVQIGTVMAHDYGDFMQQTQRRAQRASIGGFGG